MAENVENLRHNVAFLKKNLNYSAFGGFKPQKIDKLFSANGQNRLFAGFVG